MEYLYTIKIRFEALDNIEARQKAIIMTDAFKPNLPEKAEIKVQRLEKGKPPEGIGFDYGKPKS